MRKYLFPVIAIAVLASCSAPKYAYHFDHYDYNSGKKTVAAEAQAPAEDQVNAEASPLLLQEETLVASADEKVVVAEPSVIKAQQSAAMKKYAAMSKAERKEFRKEAKTQVKAYIKAVKSGDKAQAAAVAQAMDHDLKLAAIFGAVGIVSLLIGGDVFWVIGGIALIIGVVFFVMWLTRQ